MAFERREILFTLPEIRDALISIDGGMGQIPVQHNMRIIEALHTRDNHSQFHIIRERYANIYRECIGKNGVMFRAGGTGKRGHEEIYEFFIPEETMLKAVLLACKRSGVMLPRGPEKKVIAKDLFIGFQFEMGHQAITLELEEAL
ncbi:MAG: hypothetical protein ACK4NR_08635 [Micavibrio sp.]